MNDTMTLDQLKHLSARDVLDLPLEQLDAVLGNVVELERRAKSARAWLAQALHLRFGDRAAALRTSRGKDTGTVRIRQDGYEVVADLPKKVEWDSVALANAVGVLRSWGEPVDEYVDVSFSVGEVRYNSWPGSIRTIFEPARIVKTGKPTYRLERVGAGTDPVPAWPGDRSAVAR